MSSHSPAPAFVLYQSPRLRAYTERLIHGFTGKPLSLGGIVTPRADVLRDRRFLCDMLGMNADRFCVPSQIHSATVLQNERGCEEGDAIVVTERNLPVAVITADCVPIILYAPDQHVGAVVHAGWRGTAQGITQITARQLIETHGADPAQLIAAIGPAIGVCCYEVSPAVAEAVSKTIPSHPQTIYIKPPVARANEQTHPFVDLKAVNRLQLEDLGVLHIDTLPECTRCEIDALWSHRRNETSRQAAFLQLKP